MGFPRRREDAKRVLFYRRDAEDAEGFLDEDEDVRRLKATG